MTARERGFLLLSSQLGDPNRRPLTVPQLRTLAQRTRNMEPPAQNRDLTETDLISIGISREQAQKILSLLNDDALLDHYLHRGCRANCIPLSRLSDHYPMAVRNRLGDDAPGCIWARGDLALLALPAVALVGSRDICGSNLEFAKEVGRQAAKQGFVLVSGNARGADKAAQESCLAAGGQVIAVVADELERHNPTPHKLYISEDSFDLPFSPIRALSRNRIIHCMGLRTFVAQCAYQQGGTWDGTVKNLRFGWSPVYCYDDRSPAMELLQNMGAESVTTGDLHNFLDLQNSYSSLFDQ
ncbi:MAG: DNA-processing protein DprA [Oscillospiraceae bacterium]|nr:DNA-processing protein DprA [Oscillospiraceae bacterium]